MSLYNPPPLPFGNTLRFTVTFYEPDGTTPINLTGYTALMEVLNCAGVAVITLTDTDGLTLGGVAGTIVVYSDMKDGDEQQVSEGSYTYYLTLISGDTVATILQGILSVTALGGS